MGCSSSVPNLSDLNSNTTENDKIEVNDIKNDDLKKMDANEQKDPEETDTTNLECNENEMLPTCDSLDQNLQLDRKFKSSPEVINDRDIPDNTEVNLMENEKEIPSIELEEDSHKLSTFKEVVDQVLLDSILNDIANLPGIKEDTQNDDKTSEEDIIQDNQNEIKDEINSNELDESETIIDDEDNQDETASPSQSECSRATRWEALADIAAELPPSLAVDPLTGQIFSLTK